MNLTEIQELIKFVSRSGVTEVEIEQKDFKIIIKSEGQAKKKGQDQVLAPPIQVSLPAPPVQIQPAQPVVTQSAAAVPPVAPAQDAKYVTIKSPMIGTFYRSAGPDKPQFVNVGDELKPGKVICIVEAMKLFNEIECEISGKLVKFLVDDASPVEYDQPLFLVDPS